MSHDTELYHILDICDGFVYLRLHAPDAPVRLFRRHIPEIGYYPMTDDSQPRVFQSRHVKRVQ